MSTQEILDSHFVDELQIIRVVDAIDSAVDDKDWERCRSYFTDEVEVDFTSLVGGAPARLRAGDLVDAWHEQVREFVPTS